MLIKPSGGIEKVFFGMEFPFDYNYPRKFVKGQIEGLEYVLQPDENFFGGSFLSEIDGLLGLAWIKRNTKLVEQNENIVIDYVNKKILFNQKSITENSIRN